MNVHVVSAADQEVTDAVAWHEGQRLGLGDSLFTVFDNAIAHIRVHPFLAPAIKNDARSYTLKRFPYTLWYVVEDDTIYVHAFAHQKRKPFYWLSRLG